MAPKLTKGDRVHLKGNKTVGVIQGFTHEKKKKLWIVRWSKDAPTTKHVARDLLRPGKVSAVFVKVLT